MITKEQASNIKKLIEEHDNIILFHHTIPDGDCIATSFGLAQALRDNYPNKNIKVAADIEDFTPSLRYMDEYLNWDETTLTPEHDDYLGIIGDVSGINRVSHFENFKDNFSKIVCYDHHENELTIPNVEEFWSQPKYPAAALMAFEMLEAMELNISERAAIIINHGIITDTNFYRLAPGDKMVFDASGKLNEIVGVKAQKELYQKMRSKSVNDIKFHGWVLENFVSKDKVAYITISEDDLKMFGYRPDQAARVEMLGDIEGIESWIFFIQYKDYVRVEFRSLNIFVNEIATEFGGGGHNHASGCKLVSMDEHVKVVDRVIQVIKEQNR